MSRHYGQHSTEYIQLYQKKYVWSGEEELFIHLHKTKLLKARVNMSQIA